MPTYTHFDTSTKNDLFKPGLRKLFDSTDREKHVFYKPMVNDLRTKQYIDDDRQMAAFELPGMLVEGQNIPLQNPVFGGYKTYTQKRMGTGFRVTDAMKRFNIHNLTKKWTKAIARVQWEGKDVEIHRMFNAPAGSGAVCGTGFNGVTLASAGHTGLGAGTAGDFDNLLSAAPSTSAMESMWYYYKMLEDDMGVYAGARPNFLFYEPTLHFIFNEIFKSVGKAHELSNTINVISSEMPGLTLYPNPRLTSVLSWGAMAKDNERFDLNVLTSVDPYVDTKDAPDNTFDTVVISQQYFEYGYGDARLYYQGNI